MTNALIGLAEETAAALVQEIVKRVRAAADGVLQTVTCAHNTQEFESYLNNKSVFYDLVVTLDNIGFGYEYYRYYEMGDARKWVVVVPERSYGTPELRQMLDKGITNGIFQRDFSPSMLHNLIVQDRSSMLAKAYYGLETGTEVAVKESAEIDAAKTRESIRYFNGIKITRICGADVKQKITSGKDEDDEVLQAFTTSSLEESDEKMEREVRQMPIMQFRLNPEWTKVYVDKLRVFFRTSSGIQALMAFQTGETSREDFENVIYRVLERDGLKKEEMELVADIFLRSVISYGKIDILLDTDGISDIRLLNRNTVNVQYKGKWYKTNIVFDTDEEYSEFIKQACVRNHKSNHLTNAQTIFTDASTNDKVILRFMIQHEMLSSVHTSTAHIRKIDKVKKTEKELEKEGFWTAQQVHFIKKAVQLGKSVVVCGESGSGKTIFLNQAIEWTKLGICGSVVQESDELFSWNHPNIEFSHCITGGGDNGVEYTLRQLTTAALLKNAELFMIGEIKGAEAGDFITAANNGAQVLTSTHSASAFDAIERLVDLSKTASDYSYEDLVRKYCKHIHYVIYMTDYHIAQIVKVVGYDEERKDILYDLYEF